MPLVKSYCKFFYDAFLNDAIDEIHTSTTTLAVKAPKISTSLHRLQPRIDLNLPPGKIFCNFKKDFNFI